MDLDVDGPGVAEAVLDLRLLAFLKRKLVRRKRIERMK